MSLLTTVLSSHRTTVVYECNTSPDCAIRTYIQVKRLWGMEWRSCLPSVGWRSYLPSVGAHDAIFLLKILTVRSFMEMSMKRRNKNPTLIIGIAFASNFGVLGGFLLGTEHQGIGASEGRNVGKGGKPRSGGLHQSLGLSTVQYRTLNKRQESGLSLDFLFLSLFLIETLALSYFRRAEITLILILVLKRCSFILIQYR